MFWSAQKISRFRYKNICCGNLGRSSPIYQGMLRTSIACTYNSQPQYFSKQHLQIFEKRSLNVTLAGIIRKPYNQTDMPRNYCSGRESEDQHNHGKQSRIAILVGVPVLTSIFYYMYSLYKEESYPHQEQDPFQVVQVHKDKNCQGKSGHLMKIKSFWLPQEFFKEKGKLEKIRHFDIHDDDVIVASFPKSGTTWIQEIIYLITHNVDVTVESTIEDRFPYLEYVYPGLNSLSKIQGQRLLKTHLPLDFLPKDLLNGKGKIVYIARNPKDVCVSFFHFIKMLTATKYSGCFHDFHDSFKTGKVAYGPWADHVQQYWGKRNSENILFITYEDLHDKPVETIQSIGSFLGKSLTHEEAATLTWVCSFNEMSKNPMTNYDWWELLGISDKNATPFFRKGMVGDWKNYYDKAMSDEICKLCEEPLNKAGLFLKDNIE